MLQVSPSRYSRRQSGYGAAASYLVFRTDIALARSLKAPSIVRVLSSQTSWLAVALKALWLPLYFQDLKIKAPLQKQGDWSS